MNGSVSGIVALLVVACAVARPASARDATSPGPLALSPLEQQVIAGAFAPVLVFHPDERYLPINPMTALATTESPDAAFDEGIDVRGRGENVKARVALYEALSQEDKLAHAAIGYRVFSRYARGRTEVVVEYWCHYVYNAFIIRLSWLPFRISDNHPGDLERLYVVLTPQTGELSREDTVDEGWARRSFRIQRIIANAHAGSVPPNQYDTERGQRVVPPVTILVERGSHAMAPDINHDGRFTPGIDSTTTGKLLWGIRDAGRTLSWPRPSYMDARDPDGTGRLCAATAGSDAEETCRPYALYSIAELQLWFHDLDLSGQDRRDFVGRTSWFGHTFTDIRVEELTAPSDAPDGRVMDRMLKRRTRTSQGIFVGYTSVPDAPALVVGRRYFWDVASRRVPDVVVEVMGLLPRGQRAAVEGEVLGSYAVDATISVLVGTGWSSNREAMTDLVAGIDLRIGRVHVRPAWRARQREFGSKFLVQF